MVKALQWKILVLSGFFLLISCGSPPVTAIPPVSDQEFEAAVEQAHDTLDVLFQNLLSPDPDYRFVGVKARFIGGDAGFEDHWTEPVDYYDDIFTVRMLDGLTFDNGLHADQLVEVPIKNILDWMVVESDGNLLGGYTIRLAYEHMTPEEQEEFVKTTGYKIK
ncbi:MAG: DUF2314 domain-containing protein [Chloroflexi bacterium]|nr:MAG: DUF2314 domain-containing protein [Chloroflexota bacterium]